MTTLLITLGIVQTTIGYLGIVILCCALFVWFILRKPERSNIDEESEALRDMDKQPCPECISMHSCPYNNKPCFCRNILNGTFYCNKEPGKELCDTQCLHCKIVESKSKGK